MSCHFIISNSKTSLMTRKNDTGRRFLHPKNYIDWFSQNAITELLVSNIPYHIFISSNSHTSRLKIDNGAIRFLGHNNDALITLISIYNVDNNDTVKFQNQLIEFSTYLSTPQAPVAQSVSAPYLQCSMRCGGCEFEPHLEHCFSQSNQG